MKVATKQYAIALYESLAAASDREASTIVRRFVALLAERGVLSQSRAITADFIRYAQRMQGVTDITLTTATSLSSRDVKEVTKQLEKALGKKIELTTRVNEELVGGGVVAVGDTVIDGSVRHRLEQLRATILANH